AFALKDSSSPFASRNRSLQSGPGFVSFQSNLNEELIEERLRDSNSTREILVALDGGGIKGAAEIMALRELSLRLSSTSPSITSLFKSFDWIGGTSLNPILLDTQFADFLKGSQSPDTNLWSFLAETRAIFDPKLKKPSFRGELLHKSLREHVGTSQLGDIEAKFVCTYVDGAMIPPRLLVFRNFPIEVQTDEDHREVEIVDALMASTAAPVFPLALLTEYHRFYAKAARHPTPSLFLSLGTGYNEPRRTSGIHFGDLPKNRVFFDRHFMRTTRNLFDVFVSQARSTSSDTACLDQAAAWCLATRSPYFRINPPNINRLSLTCTDAKKVADFLWGVMYSLRFISARRLAMISINSPVSSKG
ncbi:unnamed protein product, partial [Mesorhabditis belari]